MPTLRFTKDHEWIRQDGDTATIGITDYAQQQLGDIVYVELPAPGTRVEAGKEAAVVESAKAASEVYAPVSGEIVAVNELTGETYALISITYHSIEFLSVAALLYLAINLLLAVVQEAAERLLRVRHA